MNKRQRKKLAKKQALAFYWLDRLLKRRILKMAADGSLEKMLEEIYSIQKPSALDEPMLGDAIDAFKYATCAPRFLITAEPV